jgi:hypothetical protein
MEVRIIENSRIPKMLSWFINISAITIYPFIISKGTMDQRTRTHEWIHIKQQKELWVIGFYILYIGFWLKNMIWDRQNPRIAYHNIPFEVEAYINDDNPLYPLRREKFGWTKWI